jgi:hypothetical protein
MEDKIKAAVIAALKGIPELDGCLPGEVFINSVGLAYRVEFDIPIPVPFAGA